MAYITAKGGKVIGSGYILIPAGPSVGTTVTSGLANAYGGYVELRSASGNAIFILGFRLRNGSAGGTYTQLQLATGGAGSEVSIGVFIDAGGLGTAVPHYLVFPLAVAASTRIAAQTASSAASQNISTTLITCNQSDLVGI